MVNNVAIVPQDQDAERFQSYALAGLLPPGCRLTCDRESRVVTLFCQGQDGGSITEQQIFTDQEFDLVVLMFEAHPEYCPLADLLSCQSGRNLERCQREVIQALDGGYIDEVIRPVRNLLSRARIKLRRFGLDFGSVVGTGYLLMPEHATHRRRS